MFCSVLGPEGQGEGIDTDILKSPDHIQVVHYVAKLMSAIVKIRGTTASKRLVEGVVDVIIDPVLAQGGAQVKILVVICGFQAQ